MYRKLTFCTWVQILKISYVQKVWRIGRKFDNDGETSIDIYGCFLDILQYKTTVFIKEIEWVRGKTPQKSPAALCRDTITAVQFSSTLASIF